MGSQVRSARLAAQDAPKARAEGRARSASKPATETNLGTRVFGCDRSSMAEPRVVVPLVPVRLRPVTPKHMCSIFSDNQGEQHETEV